MMMPAPGTSWAPSPFATELVGLGQRRLDIGNLDVEGDVALVALGHVAGDAAADPDPILAQVLLPIDRAVVHRVVGVDLPAEQLGVVAVKLVGVAADDLEVHHRLSHRSSSFAAPRGR